MTTIRVDVPCPNCGNMYAQYVDFADCPNSQFSFSMTCHVRDRGCGGQFKYTAFDTGQEIVARSVPWDSPRSPAYYNIQSYGG